MIITIHNSTVHVLNILDQILLCMLAITTIVSLVMPEHIVMNMLSFMLRTHYGMEQVVLLKTVAAMYDAGMPWFLRQFPTAITGDLEVRICHDSDYSNQNVMIEQLQLYVQ